MYVNEVGSDKMMQSRPDPAPQRFLEPETIFWNNKNCSA